MLQLPRSYDCEMTKLIVVVWFIRWRTIMHEHELVHRHLYQGTVGKTQSYVASVSDLSWSEEGFERL